MLMFFTQQMTGLYILILEGGGCCQRTKQVMLIDLRHMRSPFFLLILIKQHHRL